MEAVDIIAALPPASRVAAAEWFGVCEELGFDPAAVFRQYRWDVCWRHATPAWWSDLERMNETNWRMLMHDTRNRGRNERVLQEMRK